MIQCKELNTSFKTQRELFDALKANKDEIISLKKSAVKWSDSYNLRVISKEEAVKDLSPKAEIGYGDYVFPVINTTNLMDSHKDVHMPGIWDKSIGEQQGKVYLVINHELEVGKVISWPKDVTMMLRELKWSDLGASYEGTTQALIFKSKLTERSNRDAYLAYKESDPVEHSIRMQYVNLYLAINSEDDDFKEEKQAWDKYYPEIANKEEADKYNYFWAVTEAKIFKEGSMVLAGSNHVTPTIYDMEAGKTTSKEPDKSTHFNVSEAIKNVKFNL